MTNIFGRKIGSAVFTLTIFAAFSFAQSTEVAPRVIVPGKIKNKAKAKIDGKDTFAEKSIEVDAKINISLCVAEGNVKINGWERNEIRAFVGNGSKVDFKIQQKNRRNEPVWVMVTAFDAANPSAARREECLSGEEIELDVPRGATVTVKGRTTETNIKAVRKATIEAIGGDIFLSDIEQGIHAKTYEGDVMVENSGGAISLATSNGNIIAFDVAPSEIGDVFQARTVSGAITLQNIEHRQTEITSNSGAIKFTGEFQSGGQYAFNTTNGTISLFIPEKSSCKVSATYGFGKFSSELKYNVLSEDNTAKTQRIVVAMGEAEASVNLTTFSGAIRIRKSK